MQIVLPFASRRDQRAFFFCALALCLIGAWCAVLQGPQTIWLDHAQAGRKLITGVVPDNPTYPIWGFSILAGGLGTGIVWLQAAAAAAVAAIYYGCARNDGVSGAAPDGATPRALWAALLMAPWFATATSYYSNSVPSILALAGTVLLWQAAGQPISWGRIAASALLFGLAANMRTEYLLIAVLLGGVLLAYDHPGRPLAIGLRFRRALVFVALALATMIPWAIFTKATVGQYRLSATNSGASAYLGLAQLPNNPWGVVLQDAFVDDLARRELGAVNANTVPADDYLKRAFVDAVKAHPVAFAERVLHGWRVMLIQGPYLPNLRVLLARDSADEKLLSLAAEAVKQRLNLNVNWYKVQELEGLGLSLGDLKARHYAVLAFEAALRILFTAAVVILMGGLAWRLLRGHRLGFVDLVAWAYMAHLFFVAGFIQTAPRHTALLLPLLLAALSWAPRAGLRLPAMQAQPLRASSQNRSSAG